MDEQKRDALGQDLGQEEMRTDTTTETLIARTLTEGAITEGDVTTRTDSTETHTGEATLHTGRLDGGSLDTGELARSLAQTGAAAMGAEMQSRQVTETDFTETQSMSAGSAATQGAVTQNAAAQNTVGQSAQLLGSQSLTGGAVSTGRLAENGEGRQVLNRLVLHEERAQIEIERERLGQVQIRRVVTEREEVVPITLRREVVEITVTEGGNGSVLLNGETLEVGRTYEFEMYEERAEVQKRVYPFQEITIAKRLEAFTQTEQIALRREELDVDKVEVSQDVLEVENVHTTTSQGGTSGTTVVSVDDPHR